MIPVSVVIITKDEEKNIGEALESVRDSRVWQYNLVVIETIKNKIREVA